MLSLSMPDEEFGANVLSLRGFQDDGVKALKAGFAAGEMKQMVCGPTGSGKTELAAGVVSLCYDQGSRVSFIADRLVLVDQASDRFWRYGIPHGVIQGDNTRYSDELIQVCSAQTIEARDYFDDLDLLIVDEAHGRRRKVWEFVKNWGGPVIGLSATPLSRGLGKIYPKLHNLVTTNDLLARGWLAPLRVYEMHEIDMSREPVGAGGEWTATQVKRRSGQLIGEMVVEWQRMTTKHFDGPVPTLVFSADIEDGALIEEEFQAAGFNFRQSTYHDTLDETRELIKQLRTGELVGLICVDRFTKGFDLPSIKCIIGARPYSSSLINFLQQLGRGMRAEEDKEYCLYLDFAGNFAGWYDAVMDYWEEGVPSLDYREQLQERRREGIERTPATCSCGMFIGRDDLFCAGCGREIRRASAEQRRLRAGRMQEVLIAPGSRRWMENRTWTWQQICRMTFKIFKKVDIPRMERFAAAQYRTLYGGEEPGMKFELDRVPPDKRVERRVYKQLNERRKK